MVSFDGTIEAQKILSAIARTGERFGAEHIVSILVGEETDTVRRFGHEQIKTFGVGKDRSKAEWRSLLRQIYAAQLISLDIASFGRWTVTDRGWAVLKGRETVALRSDVLQPRTRRSRKTDESPGTTPVALDDPLLAALKTLRTSLAKSQSVPAYVIFPDRTLIEMAAARPATLEAMRAVHGVGRRKLERYGEAFLAVVAAHRAAVT